jgi:hypothetical protein
MGEVIMHCVRRPTVAAIHAFLVTLAPCAEIERPIARRIEVFDFAALAEQAVGLPFLRAVVPPPGPLLSSAGMGRLAATAGPPAAPRDGGRAHRCRASRRRTTSCRG